MLLPVHEVNCGIAPLGVSVITQSSGREPVFFVVTVITPAPVTVSEATKFVASVEQPAVFASAGNTIRVATNSEIDVLHAAIAATPSDIFDRMT